MLALHSRDFWGKNNASFFRTRPVKNSLERMRSVKYYRVITSIGGSSLRVAVPSPWGKTGGGGGTATCRLWRKSFSFFMTVVCCSPGSWAYTSLRTGSKNFGERVEVGASWLHERSEWDAGHPLLTRPPSACPARPSLHSSISPKTRPNREPVRRLFGNVTLGNTFLIDKPYAYALSPISLIFSCGVFQSARFCNERL